MTIGSDEVRLKVAGGPARWCQRHDVGTTRLIAATASTSCISRRRARSGPSRCRAGIWRPACGSRHRRRRPAHAARLRMSRRSGNGTCSSGMGRQFRQVEGEWRMQDESPTEPRNPPAPSWGEGWVRQDQVRSRCVGAVRFTHSARPWDETLPLISTRNARLRTDATTLTRLAAAAYPLPRRRGRGVYARC